MAAKISPRKLPVSLEKRLELLNITQLDFIGKTVILGTGDEVFLVLYVV